MNAATMGPPQGQRVSRRTMLGLVLTASGAALLAACAPQAPAPAPTAAPAKPAESKPAEAAKPTEAAKPAEVAKPAATTAPAAPAAAAKPTEPPKPAEAKPAAKAGETPKSGGTLRWGMVGDIVTTDAVLWSPAANETCGAVCDSLVSYDDTLKPIPRLAESWELSTDNTRIKLNLRKGVQFHSGREMTSDDVEYNIMRVRDPKNGFAAVVAPGSNWWTSIEKPDKYTVVLTSDKPRPGVFDWLNYLRIQDKDVRDGPDGNTKVGGTGPFKWIEWIPGDHITMEKNTNYWDKTLPYVDNYEVKIFRDQQSMVAALEANALDVAALAPIPDAVRLRDNPQFQIIETHDIGQFFYGSLNVSQPPLDNKMLRQAVAWSIDRQRFTEQIMKGFVGQPRNLPWADISPAYDAAKNKTYGYDLEKAKALLSQSGATNVEFDISYALAGFQAEYAAIAQVIQADLAKIGVKTNLKPMDPPTFTQVGSGNKPTYNGMRLSAGAFAQLGEAASEFALSRTMGYASNQSAFYDPKFEQMVLAASTEPDAAKRKAIYNDINDFLLDVAYCLPFSAYSNIMATRANVRGMRWEPSTAVTLREMWLA